MARDRAPEVIAGRGRIDEAWALRVGAAQRLRSNPEIDTQLGRRSRPDDSSLDFEVAQEQAIELGGRRGPRVASAEAVIDREQASTEDAARVAAGQAAAAFLTALHGITVHDRLVAASQLAADLAAATEKRLAAGDASLREAQLARIARARGAIELRHAAADRDHAIAELRSILGLGAGTDLELVGSLAVAPPARASLHSRLTGRPDVRALQAEVREGEADAALGSSSGWPDLTFRIGYAQEEDADILFGGLRVTLPVFARGQDVSATGRAKARRARAQVTDRAARADAELAAAYEEYLQRIAIVREMERDLLPVLDEAETTARRSFEVGEISLPELLVQLRDLQETRLSFPDRQLEAALAGAEVITIAGGWR